jgi:hypothetical protein
VGIVGCDHAGRSASEIEATSVACCVSRSVVVAWELSPPLHRRGLSAAARGQGCNSPQPSGPTIQESEEWVCNWLQVNVGAMRTSVVCVIGLSAVVAVGSIPAFLGLPKYKLYRCLTLTEMHCFPQVIPPCCVIDIPAMHSSDVRNYC